MLDNLPPATVRMSPRRARRFRRVVPSVAIAVFLCVGLAAAAYAGTRAVAKPTLTIANANGCGNLSPIFGLTDEVKLAYEPLIGIDHNGRAYPGLATSWKVKPGNKVIELTLRRNARFSDGSPVTAEAVKTYMEFRRTKTTQYNASMGPIRSIEAVSALPPAHHPPVS